jgi:DNA-binding MarR family transcriptional regulator
MLVSLTEHGRSLTAALRTGRDEMAAELFKGMPPEQLAAFTAGMEMVIKRLRAPAPPGC